MTAPDPPIQTPNESQLTLQFDKFASFVQQFSGNLALGGAFVETPKVRPVGTEVQLTCELPDGFSLLRGLGDVVWTRPRDNGPGRPAGMGIRFNALDQNSRELVLKIVEENLKEGGEPFEIERIPADATDSALPAPHDVTLDEISEDPTVVGSLVQPSVSTTSAVAGATAPAGPGFAAPWGEKLPEMPVDILEAESDPEIEEAVRSIRPDPSIAPAGPAPDPASGVIAIDPDAAPGASTVEGTAAPQPAAPQPAAPQPAAPQPAAPQPAAPEPSSPVLPLAPELSIPAAPELEIEVPAAPTFDIPAAPDFSEPFTALDEVDGAAAPPVIEAPLVDDETYVPATPAVEAAGMTVELEPEPATAMEPTFEASAEPAATFEASAESAATFEASAEPAATFEPSFEPDLDVDLDPPTVVFAAEDASGVEASRDTSIPEPTPEAAADPVFEPAPAIESLPSEPEAASFAAIDEPSAAEVTFETPSEPTAEVVFEPPADDLDAFALDDDVEGVDFGGTFSSAPELDEVDFGGMETPDPEPAPVADEIGRSDDPAAADLGGESVTAAMPFDAPVVEPDASSDPVPEASFAPTAPEPTAGFDDGFDNSFDNSFDEPAVATAPIETGFDPVAPTEPITADPAAGFEAELVTPADAAVTAFESAGIESDPSAEAPFGGAAASFGDAAAPAFGTPSHDVGDSIGAIHADDFVDPWDGDPVTEPSVGLDMGGAPGAETAGATSAGAASRRLPLRALVAAVAVLAVIAGAYLFRDDLMGWVGLGSPDPAVQQAGGPRPGGGPPPGSPAGGPADGPGRQAAAPPSADGTPAGAQDATDPSGPGVTPDDNGAVEDRAGSVADAPGPDLTPGPGTASPPPTVEPVAVDEPPIEPLAAAPPPPVAPPPPAAPPRAAAVSGGVATILSIDSRSTGNGTQIVVRFDRPIDPSYFEFDPLAWAADREMLKLFQVENYPLNEIRVSTAEVSRIRLGFHGTDELRLVFDRSSGGRGGVQLGGDTLTLSFPSR